MFNNSSSMKPMVFGVSAICGLAIFGSLYFGSQEQITVQQHEQYEMLAPENLDNSESEELAGQSFMIPGVEKTAQGFQFDNEMKQRLQDISDAYEEQIKYPSYSLPIQEGELEAKYLPDILVEDELPAVLDDPNSPRLSVTPNKFRYFSGDEIKVRAQITGLDEHALSDVTGRLLRNGSELGFAAVIPSEQQAHSYQLQFNSLDLNDVQWKELLDLEVEFQIQGQTYTRMVSLEYLALIAQLEDVAAAEVRGEYLEMPVYVSTEKPGYHRIQGNLYDIASDQPLVHLTAEDSLAGNAGMLTLKAHIAALKAAGSEGPYELRDLQLRRLPSEPDYVTEFGRIMQPTFKVDGFRFADYQDKPYINEKAQRIAKELRKIGS